MKIGAKIDDNAGIAEFARQDEFCEFFNVSRSRFLMQRKAEAGESVNEVDHVTLPRFQVEQLQRSAGIGAIASSIAHEFNNILTTVLNHAKFGLKTDDPEVIKRSFTKVLDSAHRAAKITTGILALSRNRSGRMQPTDVAAMVDEVLVILEKDLKKHQIRIERRVHETPVAAMVPAQIQHVLMNLIINARQAMENGGVVEVIVDRNRASDMAEISVKDTGTGIAPDKLSHIFDPFFSTKNGPDSDGLGGTGLGLSICREIIERHEGRIRVESLVGKGTTFTIKLPCSDESQSTRAA